MEPIKWFDRRFDFNIPPQTFLVTQERLWGTPVRLTFKIANIPAEKLTTHVNDKWSIKEHIGHLNELEGLWQGRLTDILEGKKHLRAWDLDNKQTSAAGHDETPTQDLLETFQKLRTQTLIALAPLTLEQIQMTALHPRLEQPMRIMDLFLFVAEHDDHHLVAINQIVKALS